MADANISLESIVQRGGDRRPHGGEDPRRADKPATVALVTYATTEDAVRRALATVEADGVLTEKPQVIRIEKS
jgi:homoserine dehydrogenase